jgi:hypothetical protein
MTQYLLDRRLGGSQGHTGQVGTIPPGFDPQTVQPVASHYTNYTILVHSALYGGSQTSPTGKNPSTHWTNSLGHRAGKNILQKRKISCPCREPSTQPSHYANYIILSIVDNMFDSCMNSCILLIKECMNMASGMESLATWSASCWQNPRRPPIELWITGTEGRQPVLSVHCVMPLSVISPAKSLSVSATPRNVFVF